jgi:uncharacterized protein YjbJ (UPF0337 family)
MPEVMRHREIEAAFSTPLHSMAPPRRSSAPTVFNARRVQFATLARPYRIPAAYASREVVESGGLMSYGTDLLDMCRSSNSHIRVANPIRSHIAENTRAELWFWRDVETSVSATPPGALEKGRVMDWNRFEGNWKQFKGNVKEKWGRLTDDDLDVINGRREQLEGKIQERYGIAKDQAKQDVEDWFKTLP